MARSLDYITSGTVQCTLLRLSLLLIELNCRLIDQYLIGLPFCPFSFFSLHCIRARGAFCICVLCDLLVLCDWLIGICIVVFDSGPKLDKKAEMARGSARLALQILHKMADRNSE